MQIIKRHLPFVIFIAIYAVLRLVLMNINYTEWGDTFRMIRGADYLSLLTWPWDEKRWPFYSFLLIPGILMNNPVGWGRLLAIFISIANLVLVYKFAKHFFSAFSNKNVAEKVSNLFALIAVFITAFNSVFLYWSFRVMADPVFALMVMLFFYSFIYRKTSNIKINFLMSLLLLSITMTRLEGLFVLVSVCLYFFLQKNFRLLFLYFLPQLLIYLPWTVYAKFIYSGSVENNYFNEAQSFEFNLQRISYFGFYTLFILGSPILLYFLIIGIQNIYKRLDFKSSQHSRYLPLVLFLLMEFGIGFIWTPSLPRIYMPVIPFLSIICAYGILKFKFPLDLDLKARLFLVLGFFSVLFLGGQVFFRMYFFGASKLLLPLLAICIGFVLVFAFSNRKTFLKYFVFFTFTYLILQSGTVLYNQKDIYKSVKMGIDGTLLKENSKIAFSDETGNTAWYLRTNGFYVKPDILFETSNDQYNFLKVNEVEYILVTNEFNRGSSLQDPRGDQRYLLEQVYSIPQHDLIEYIIGVLKVYPEAPTQVFVTKLYKVI